MTADNQKHFPPAQANGVPLLRRRVVKAEIDNANRFLTWISKLRIQGLFVLIVQQNKFIVLNRIYKTGFPTPGRDRDTMGWDQTGAEPLRRNCPSYA